MRNQFRSHYRSGYRAKAGPRPRARMLYRFAARPCPGTRFWSRPPNPARLLRALVRRILKFHESEPLLRLADNHP